MQPIHNTLRTRLVTPNTKIVRTWHLIDAAGVITGRTATRVAQLLTGRGKPGWSPMQDIGDHVVVINATKVKMSGQKTTSKVYRHHSTYLGHLKTKTYQQVMEERPIEVVRRAIVGMLPRTRLRKGYIKRLHIFVDATHPYKDRFTK